MIKMPKIQKVKMCKIYNNNKKIQKIRKNTKAKTKNIQQVLKNKTNSNTEAVAHMLRSHF